ncbi:hypothetical protein CYY_006992 [Polysphondylium violaceum]|uniref:phosphoinositide 5-phosphatase n=1 Tax=Polysphondylium violaceum TaxID=133409 RepID=A0A8J4PR31_9MYCE|nr:hypothetical protein CYY_006992 [Polysphondylium violaceum]
MTIELYSNINLIVLDSFVILQPEQRTHANPKSIFIDRTTLKIEQRLYENSIFQGTVRSCTKVYGCLGIINLLSGPFLICVSEYVVVGNIRENQIINKVTKTTITPIARNPTLLNEDERKEEKQYLNLLSDYIESCDFYFSYNFDVTQSEQRASNIESNQLLSTLPLWKRADKRFFWNYHLQEIFIENEFDSFIIPMMDGFIKIIECEINSNTFKYAFISRRSCKRTGARYHIRGADPLGNVANFVETEQVILFDQVLTSFVQVRGSIPLIWQQKGKGMKPKPIVDHSLQTDDAFQAHMNELIELYGPQVIVSLIDQCGGESAIGDAFESESLLFYPDKLVTYAAFDFHERCKNNKYENLAELLDRLKNHLDRFGYLFRSTIGEPSLLQTGGFRTNCIDCLDRTNVVQSVFARYILHSQLTRMGIISQSEKITDHPVFEAQFKNIWADNADVMSEQYTGTNALKTDFTRTGKRSMKGTMTDGMNSVRRYINKNFKDDEKQLAIDLFLGKFLVEKWTPEHSSINGDLDYNVYFIYDPEIRGIPCTLQINLPQSCITGWIKSSCKRKDYYFSSIYLLEKSKLNHRQLNLYYLENPTPETFQFSSSLQREQFLQEIYKQPFAKQFLPIGEVDIYSIENGLKIKEKTDIINNLTKDFESETSPSISPVISPNVNTTPNNNNNSPTTNNSIIPIKHKLIDTINSFVGSWNMENITISHTFLEEWIPREKDLYSISAQRIASDRPSPSFVMKYTQYWFYLVRQYLGPEYVMVANAVSPNTASIVLIKKTLITSVNNIQVSFIQKRLPFKKTGIIKDNVNSSISTSNNNNSTNNTPPSPSSPTLGPTTNTSNTSNTTTNAISSFFFGSKLKDMGSKLMEQSQKSTDILFNVGGKEKFKDTTTHFGTTISFQLCETSVCFLNYCNNNPTNINDILVYNNPTDINGEPLITYIKSRQYINGSNRYVFWSGDYDYSTLSKFGWAPLGSQSSLSNVDPGRGVVFWKSLFGAEALIESGLYPVNGENALATTAMPSYSFSDISLYPPLSCSFTLPILSPYTWLSNVDIPSFIIIRSLRTEPFELMAVNTKLDAFLEFNAFHLISDDNIAFKSSIVRSSMPSWPETLELKSFIDDKEYLKTQYIQVALFGKELMDQSLIGKGNIPLKFACGDSTYQFRIPLNLEDEFSCFLCGDIQVFSKSEISQIILEESKVNIGGNNSRSPSPPVIVSNSISINSNNNNNNNGIITGRNSPSPSPPTIPSRATKGRSPSPNTTTNVVLNDPTQLLPPPSRPAPPTPMNNNNHSNNNNNADAIDNKQVL